MTTIAIALLILCASTLVTAGVVAISRIVYELIAIRKEFSAVPESLSAINEHLIAISRDLQRAAMVGGGQPQPYSVTPPKITRTVYCPQTKQSKAGTGGPQQP